MPPLQAVTFDFWNTLIRAGDAGKVELRLVVFGDVLAGAGFDVAPDAIADAMAAAVGRFDERWKANQHYDAAAAVTDMVARLGLPVDDATRGGLIAAIEDPDPSLVPRPAPNVGDALEALRSAGVRIGIVCDVGLTPSATLRRYLERNGLLGYFDHWSFSDEVGAYKPDPMIFDHALAGLGGVTPGRAARVGDLRRTDIGGARARGLFTVRYTGIADDPGDPADGTDRVEGDAVVADHADLAATLGLA